MASTSIHFPRGLLARLDAVASERQTSRNKLVIDACLALLERERREWPDGFFGDSDLNSEDLAELRAVGSSFYDAIAASRRDRDEAPFQ
ncbi:MAG: hypothetical protein R3F39_18115 [Myxococcota bacterium]